jgi:hypothetical protein
MESIISGIQLVAISMVKAIASSQDVGPLAVGVRHVAVQNKRLTLFVGYMSIGAPALLPREKGAIALVVRVGLPNQGGFQLVIAKDFFRPFSDIFYPISYPFLDRPGI